VDEDPEFGVFIPLRNGALVEGFPVRLPGLGCNLVDTDKDEQKKGKSREEIFSHEKNVFETTVEP
jgi:hypothetical protein